MRETPTRYLLALALLSSAILSAEEPVRITVNTARAAQTFQGMGAGVIFYEGHVTSLAARNKNERQEQLYDDMFLKVPNDFLQLMIRETHEPKNDNPDPWKQAFDDKNFEYCKQTIEIAKAALKRRPGMKFLATMCTPPPWMKTNNEAGGGGEARATLKAGMELEFAEYLWAFAEHMQRNGVTVQYLSIANEPDWAHTQPGCSFTAEKYAALFKTVADYFDAMAKKFPNVTRPKLVGPNTLSAPGAAKDYIPRILQKAGPALEAIGVHDYDPRGERFEALKRIAGPRSVWMTEWCARKKDASPGMINSATEYGVAMHDAFKGGANVWMAYDWAYPPRDSGEALIHIDWGNDYKLTKPYWLFRQWCEPLVSGMRVVETAVAGPGTTAAGHAGIKPTAFLAADGRTLVIHVVNAQDKGAAIILKVTGNLAIVNSAARSRTSAEEDGIALQKVTGAAGNLADLLPPRSMVTYRIEAPQK